jgi:hypothetical protein
MSDPAAQEAELITIIKRITCSRKPVLHTAAIYHDLHIGGDDADELLTEISRRFGVSFSGFNFADYFPNETECGPLLIGLPNWATGT